ncbi:MAG TPA: hypothetical protein VHZ55_22870 [Bryobacteraceae bacterium]|jgi:hypothetical protein|nr:hypothetical protein [Bryobacteraceae bacterium]
MKTLMFGCFLAASVFSLTAAADQMSGYISDAHCGAKHHSVSEANTKCVKDMCIKGGADPVMVVEGSKVVKFDADSKEKAIPFAGKEVTVDGTMDGDTLKINSIAEATK